MIVKFMKRGQGKGRGPIEYLLGKDYKREGASLLRGDPDLTRDLIDSSNFSKRYTSGVLSFAEEDIPVHLKNELMDDFERTILAGLEPDQYNVLWVEHKDKGRLELNFVIVNTELRSGKRLQPYFRPADFHLVNNWQNYVNARHEFSDPNDPSKKRILITASDISKSRAEAVEQINSSLTELVKSGAVNDRQDVLNALESSGFTVARETKQSISIADPDGGKKNIRLKGAIYERSFNASQLDAEEIERAGASYRESAGERAERAKAALEKSVAIKRESNIKRYSSKPERASGADRRNAVTDESSRASHVAPDGVNRADSPSRSVFSHALAKQADSSERGDNQQPESAINTVKSERERTEMRQQTVRADRHDSARVRERLQSHSGEKLNDRARAEANESVRKSDSLLRRAAGTIKRAAEAVSKAAAGAASALSAFAKSVRGSDDTEQSNRHAVSALERACHQFFSQGAVNAKADDEMSAESAYESNYSLKR